MSADSAISPAGESASPVLSPAAAANARVICDHCGLAVPSGMIEPGADLQFCCGGCRAVYETIHACGLDSYYRLRQAADAAAARPVSLTQDDSFESFDSPTFAELYITRDARGLCSADLVLEGVTCAACVWLVEKLPRVLGGVVEARLSLRQAIVRVTWDPGAVSLSRIARTLARFGYRPHPARGQSRKDLHLREERRRLVHLGAAGAIMGNVMLLGLALYCGVFGSMEQQFTTFFRWISAILGTISLAWPGAIFFTSAYSALRARALNLDVPIALALLVGGIAGLINTILNRGEIYFDSLAALVFLLLVGRFLQYRQQRRADGAVELLFSLTPSTCHLIEESGQALEVPVEALKPGNLVEVRSGELIPADGAIESGHSAVNQALLTGEARPVSVGPGDLAFGGAQNIGSALRIRVASVGDQTRVGRLMSLVERGIQEKPAIVQLADRVGAWFVVVVSLVAAGVLAFWSRYSVSAAVDHTVALLIVTCPCVLGLATPLTIAIAIGRLARQDILVKSGAALERLARSGRLVLDKTGTLTRGRLQLLHWIGDDAAKPAVARIEAQSNHPIARALVEALAPANAPDDASEPADVTERHDGGITGVVAARSYRIGSPTHFQRHGITIPAELDEKRRTFESAAMTVVLIARDGQCIALAALGDQIRDDSADSIAQLRRIGWHPSILSGDANPVVAAVARQVGIDPAIAIGQATPEEKLARVATREQGAGITVMVGDGVNDAAALAAADVGIAVHGGAEASLAAADVYIARPGLEPLVELIRTSRHTMRIIRRNLLISLAYNLLAGTLAAIGVMNPLIAAILMPVSSATVLSLAIASISKPARQGR